MVFEIFFWFLHNAIILLMERECNVSFFTKKSPGPQRKNEPKKSGNEKIRKVGISCFWCREISHSKKGGKADRRGFWIVFFLTVIEKIVFIRFFSVCAAHCEKFTAIIDIYWGSVRNFTMVFSGKIRFFPHSCGRRHWARNSSRNISQINPLAICVQMFYTKKENLNSGHRQGEEKLQWKQALF